MEDQRTGAAVTRKAPLWKRALRLVGIGCGGLMGLGIVIVLLGALLGSGQKQKESQSAKGAAVAPATVASVVQPIDPTAFDARRGTPCATTGRVTKIDFAVRTETALLTSPEIGASPVTFGSEKPIPFPMELSASVRELCRQGEWSEVRVVSYPYASMQGWVPFKTLRKVPFTPAGRRIYAVADFKWPANTGSVKVNVVQIANRIMSDRPDCLALDTGNLTLVGDGRRGTFSLPCFVDRNVASFDFRATDAATGRSFVPIAPREPISKGDAYNACETATKKRVNHPSTVEMSMMAMDLQDLGDGNTQFRTTFTAKNSFGLELKFKVVCDFFGEELTDVGMVEAG